MQLVPHFMMEMLNVPGVPGVFIASLAAGSLRCFLKNELET